MADGIATQRLDAQNADGRMQPGTEGWWQVWGARAHHVRAGDMVVVKFGDDYCEAEVVEIDHGNGIAPKVTATDGRTFRIGGLQAMVLLRKGTHHTLAP